ncbi:tripartite motif-containing protein 5-like isoform X2 [Sceloporus undulatus]|uniref:tripartite motif-containing protein 5-like isoform X2 n=1 Tax=Sceloporus undulatus TaxID=8520 RepID=UPI001C4C847F|nr:tripartite motif-containing protein 5-like isoform X2 [Sceloporus undulatus]
MENAHSPKDPKGGTACLICLKPCQNPTTQTCGHNFCQACSSQSWEEALLERTDCSICQDFFLKNKPGSKEPVGKMEGTTRLTTVDKTKKVDQSLCEIHKEVLNLFCVEDQALLCSVCRKSWDHTEHTVIPRNQEVKTEHQGTGRPLSGQEDSFPNTEPKSLPVIGYTNDPVDFQGKETLDGNEKDDTEKLVLFEQWVDFNLEEKKEEATQSNSKTQNSIIWIVLVLFIIQIAGLVTTIFVFTKAKADPEGRGVVTSTTPCCPPGWFMNQGNCYHVLELEGSWEAGQQHCSSLGASLAVIGNLEKLNDAVSDKDSFNHWVGFQRESGERWKWPNGTEFNNLFEIEGDGRCAFLIQGAVSSADCSVKKKWLCSQGVKISRDRCRGT